MAREQSGKDPSGGILFWGAGSEYEGDLTKLGNNGFSAHIRRVRESRFGTRAEHSSPDFYRRFLAQEFLVFFRKFPESTFHVSVTSVQRSSKAGYQLYINGRFTTDEMSPGRQGSDARFGRDARSA